LFDVSIETYLALFTSLCRLFKLVAPTLLRLTPWHTITRSVMGAIGHATATMWPRMRLRFSRIWNRRWSRITRRCITRWSAHKMAFYYAGNQVSLTTHGV